MSLPAATTLLPLLFLFNSAAGTTQETDEQLNGYYLDTLNEIAASAG